MVRLGLCFQNDSIDLRAGQNDLRVASRRIRERLSVQPDIAHLRYASL